MLATEPNSDTFVLKWFFLWMIQMMLFKCQGFSLQRFEVFDKWREQYWNMGTGFRGHLYV